MNLRITLIFIAVAINEGCHLHGICRKKRDVKDSDDGINASPLRKKRSIHGGCAAARMINPEYGYKKTLENYGLRDEAINSQLAKCVKNKVDGIPIPLKYIPINKQEIVHYYFVYNWYQYNQQCTDHASQCAALKDCIIQLIRMEFLRNYKPTLRRG